MHGTRSAALLGLVAFSVMGLAGPASAETTTFTERDTFSESWSDQPFLCHDELYTHTANGRSLTHGIYRLDANDDLAFLRFTNLVWGRIAAVPLDGTGPTYVGHFHEFDLETIRNVRHGTLAETDTDLSHALAWGSDGSRVNLTMHHHFTITANGDVSIEFDRVRLAC